MAKRLLKSDNLLNDEFKIECDVRQIHGSLRTQFRLLDERLIAEQTNPRLEPERPHELAMKDPNVEISICAVKLQNLQLQLLRCTQKPTTDKEEVDIITSRLLHLLGRFRRIFPIEPVKSSVEKLIAACETLVDICEKALENVEVLSQSFTDISSVQIDTSEALSLMDNPVSQTTNRSEPGTSSTPKDPTLSVTQVVPHPITTVSNLIYTYPTNMTQPLLSGGNTLTNYSTQSIPGNAKVTFPQAFNSTAQLQSVPNYANYGDLPGLPTRSTHSSFTPIHKWNVSFDGSASGMAVEKFLFRVEHLANTNQIPTALLINEVCFLLKATAKEHYWLVLERKPNWTWSEMKESLLYRFQDRRTDSDLRQLIEARKQKVRESFMDFYYDILNHTLGNPEKEYASWFKSSPGR